MWNRRQEQLLHEMVDWGLKALVIKTASLGLDHRHLGKSIADLEPYFLQLHAAHGFHVCGEGKSCAQIRVRSLKKPGRIKVQSIQTILTLVPRKYFPRCDGSAGLVTCAM